MSEPQPDILTGTIVPAPSASLEFVAAGYRFGHHPEGATRGQITLAHPHCPRLSVQYGTRDCFSLEQAVQLILYVYQKDYQFRSGSAA